MILAVAFELRLAAVTAVGFIVGALATFVLLLAAYWLQDMRKQPLRRWL